MKIVLAYSGGLDTSVCIPWLKERYNAEVIAYTSNVGQKEDPARLRRKALRTGASKFYCDDLREEFASRFILPALKAGCLYQGRYPLATSLSRPLIAEGLVRIAEKEGADALSHGCTGKGNDQVRFELTFRYLAPHLKVIAPLREWEFRSREEEMDYARRKNVPVPVTRKKPYSVDWNLWGISIECGILEDPWNEPPEEAYQITTSPRSAPDTPGYITVDFRKGVPTGINGRTMPLTAIIEKCSRIGCRHGVGRIDLVEDRLVGIKSREIYEAPAATILLTAHRELERLVLGRELFNAKEALSQEYARLIYYGQWFSRHRECLAAFVEETQKHVTGQVRLRLYRGTCEAVGRRSPFSLYQENLATYTAADTFDHKAAQGFIQIFGLPSLLEGARERK